MCLTPYTTLRIKFLFEVIEKLTPGGKRPSNFTETLGDIFFFFSVV